MLQDSVQSGVLHFPLHARIPPGMSLRISQDPADLQQVQGGENRHPQRRNQNAQGQDSEEEGRAEAASGKGQWKWIFFLQYMGRKERGGNDLQQSGKRIGGAEGKEG